MARTSELAAAESFEGFPAFDGFGMAFAKNMPTDIEYFLVLPDRGRPLSLHRHRPGKFVVCRKCVVVHSTESTLTSIENVSIRRFRLGPPPLASGDPGQLVAGPEGLGMFITEDRSTSRENTTIHRLGFLQLSLDRDAPGEFLARGQAGQVVLIQKVRDVENLP